MKPLVHASVTARVDYCNMVLTSSPRSVTDKLVETTMGAERRRTSRQWHMQA